MPNKPVPQEVTVDTYDAGLPTYLATSSCRSASNHVGCLVTAYHHASVTSEFRTSP